MNEERTNISDGEKLISVKEYAQKHSVAERTVEKWCEQNLLPGAIREKIGGGFCRYRHMIPPNAQPVRASLAEQMGKPGMLTPAEYAEQNGLNRKTVIHWCEQGLLDGMEKIKRGTRHKYLIPKDAQPAHKQKQPVKEEPEMEPQEINPEGMRMLTTAEYAERYHYRPQSVAYWCKTGKLQGVVKETSKTRGFAGFRYMIPEKQALETPKRDYVRTAPKKMAPPTPKVVLKSNREKMQHILKFCGVKTYKQLSMDTGWPVMEVRRVYDELHEALGV